MNRGPRAAREAPSCARRAAGLASVLALVGCRYVAWLGDAPSIDAATPDARSYDAALDAHNEVLALDDTNVTDVTDVTDVTVSLDAPPFDAALDDAPRDTPQTDEEPAPINFCDRALCAPSQPFCCRSLGRCIEATSTACTSCQVGGCHRLTCSDRYVPTPPASTCSGVADDPCKQHLRCDHIADGGCGFIELPGYASCVGASTARDR